MKVLSFVFLALLVVAVTTSSNIHAPPVGVQDLSYAVVVDLATPAENAVIIGNSFDAIPQHPGDVALATTWSQNANTTYTATDDGADSANRPEGYDLRRPAMDRSLPLRC